jgi:hypothetical protein
MNRIIFQPDETRMIPIFHHSPPGGSGMSAANGPEQPFTKNLLKEFLHWPIIKIDSIEVDDGEKWAAYSCRRLL